MERDLIIILCINGEKSFKIVWNITSTPKGFVKTLVPSVRSVCENANFSGSPPFSSTIAHVREHRQTIFPIGVASRAIGSKNGNHFSVEVAATKRARSSNFGLKSQSSHSNSPCSGPFSQSSYYISGQNALIHSHYVSPFQPDNRRWSSKTFPRSSFSMLFKWELKLYIKKILFKISLQTICHSVADVECSHNIKPDPG